MRLIDIYSIPYRYALLYSLLKERKPEQNISHKLLPEWSDHVAFVDSKPYTAWYAIEAEDEYVGVIYLTGRREIGIQIFDNHQGNGYGTWAVENLLAKHPGAAYANVAPSNDQSHNFWRRLGGNVVQLTYEIHS